VLETPKPTDAGGQGFTGTDVGLTTHIAEILKEAHMPERRDAKAATGAPALQETSLTDAPYRSTIQLDAAPPGTDVPSAVELSRTQNKLVMPGEVIEQPFTKGAVVSLHTMKTDLQSAAINKKLTIVRAASMEAQKRAAAGEVPTLATKKPGGFRSSLFLVVTILVLVALGGAALYAVYYLKVKPVTQGPVGVGILFAEQQLALPIDGQSAANVKQSIERVMSQGGANGTIVEIVPTTQGGDSSAPVRPATTGEFLRALGAHPTDEFVRSLSDQFFFGIHFADSPSPVFVIPVVSYDNAFAGMLAWEKTIDIELGGIFVQLPLYRASAVKALIASTTAPEATSTATTFATTTATSTKTGQGTTTKVVASTTSIVAPSTAANPTMNELSPPRTFKDLVMKNYDVRALKDDNDGIVLYYSFPPTQNLLIISASPYSFPEIISRLQAARRL
jgi:hypothetical protein